MVSLLCHTCSPMPSGLINKLYISAQSTFWHISTHLYLITYPFFLDTTCASHIMLWIVPDHSICYHTSVYMSSPLSWPMFSFSLLLNLDITPLNDIFAASCPSPLKNQDSLSCFRDTPCKALDLYFFCILTNNPQSIYLFQKCKLTKYIPRINSLCALAVNTGLDS